jgi:putative protein-disulfide isomerase
MLPAILLPALMLSITDPADSLTRPRPHFIYVYDPLCGWCYGFSPVMEALWAKYQDQATLEVVPGGMVRGDRVGPVGEVAPYIREAYKQVEDRTGVLFGPAYLADLLGEGSTIMDSEPPCLAQIAFRQQLPGQELRFAAALQKAIYHDGLAPRDREGLCALAVRLGADPDLYRNALDQDDTWQEMINAFNRSEGLGVSGFPTLFMELDNRRYILSRGYATEEALLARIAQILREEGLH